MTEREIFEHLLKLAETILESNGPVTSCLVRNGEILAYGVTTHPFKHSEYVLLEEIVSKNIIIEPDDIVYVTVEPCGKRTPGGEGEELGDCTTNLIKSGVKHVVYAAADSYAAGETRGRFAEAGCELRQINDKDITDRASDIFNLNIVR